MVIDIVVIFVLVFMWINLCVLFRLFCRDFLVIFVFYFFIVLLYCLFGLD